MLYLGQSHPPFDKAWTPTLLSLSTEQLPLDESSLHEKNYSVLLVRKQCSFYVTRMQIYYHSGKFLTQEQITEGLFSSSMTFESYSCKSLNLSNVITCFNYQSAK